MFLSFFQALEIAFSDPLTQKVEPRLNDSVGQARPDDRSDGKAHDHHQIRKLEVQYIMQPRKVLLPLNTTREIWVRLSCRQASYGGH
jgi:hypothetical protein